jgi:hypothetical protein
VVLNEQRRDGDHHASEVVVDEMLPELFDAIVWAKSPALKFAVPFHHRPSQRWPAVHEPFAHWPLLWNHDYRR